MKDKTNAMVRNIMKEKLQGVLISSVSLIGSCPRCMPVEYCFDSQGELVLRSKELLSHINAVRYDNQVSLIVSDYDSISCSDIQITLLGNLHYCEDQEEAAQWYHMLFSNTCLIEEDMREFLYFRIKINEIEYINALGEQSTIYREEFLFEQIFTIDQIQKTCHYMNQEHQDALRQYCEAIDLSSTKGEDIEVICFDKEGMWILFNQKRHFIPFTRTISNLAMLRAILIALAKQYGLLKYQEY